MTTRFEHRNAYEKLDKDLDRVNAIYQEAARRSTAITLRRLAHGILIYAPGATHALLDFSDQGEWMTLAGIRIGRDNIEAQEWEQALDLTPSPIDDFELLVSDLGSDDERWKAFADHTGPYSFELNLALVLEHEGEYARRMDALLNNVTPEPPVQLQEPAERVWVWFGQPPVGTETLLMVLVDDNNSEANVYRPLLALDRDLALGLEVHARDCAKALNITAVLREFQCFDTIARVTP